MNELYALFLLIDTSAFVRPMRAAAEFSSVEKALVVILYLGKWFYRPGTASESGGADGWRIIPTIIGCCWRRAT